MVIGVIMFALKHSRQRYTQKTIMKYDKFSCLRTIRSGSRMHAVYSGASINISHNWSLEQVRWQVWQGIEHKKMIYDVFQSRQNNTTEHSVKSESSVSLRLNTRTDKHTHRHPYSILQVKIISLHSFKSTNEQIPFKLFLGSPCKSWTEIGIHTA